MSATILCLASYHKGEPLMRECRTLGCRVVLVTREALLGEWSGDVADRVFPMPDLFVREHMINAVSWLAREEDFGAIVALDEFDLEMAAILREHLRLPGLGETAVRFFRDKLAMRTKAAAEGIRVPPFVAIANFDRIRAFMSEVPAPWVLKPRYSASAIGIRKIDDPEQLWRSLDELGDAQSHHLLEKFIPGGVYHVDSVVWKGEVVFAEASGYVSPPFEVYHGGGLFCTRILDRDSAESRELVGFNRELSRALGMQSGVLHSEFIRAEADGSLFFLETAARVGGAHIADVLEAATGVNLWREWGRLEVAAATGADYQPPRAGRDYAGILISLARQEWPDTSAYDDPEISMRVDKRHHAGLLVRSPDPRRVDSLLRGYMRRFRDDFYASMPAASRAVE